MIFPDHQIMNWNLTDINKVISEAVEITKVGTKAKDISFIINLR